MGGAAPFCPHAGEDLAETGVVINGVLRCLGHNFEYDLTTGSCLNARSDPLHVKVGSSYEEVSAAV